MHLYLTNEVMGYLFGVSDSTVSQLLARVVLLLVAGQQYTICTSDSRPKYRHQLAQLEDLSGLRVVIERFGQAVEHASGPVAATPVAHWQRCPQRTLIPG